MATPLSSKRGLMLRLLVWVLAPLSAAATASAVVLFFASAALAESAFVVTVKKNVARSGTVSTEPLPATVIVFGLAVSAEWAKCGCATPAIAAAAKSTRAAMAIFIPVIRRRGIESSRGMQHRRGQLVAPLGRDPVPLVADERVGGVGEVDR